MLRSDDMLALSSKVDNAQKSDGVRALKHEHVRCSVCRSVFKGRIPKGGDGSALVPYRHSRIVSEFPHHDRLETCPGSLQSANAGNLQTVSDCREERQNIA